MASAINQSALKVFKVLEALSEDGGAAVPISTVMARTSFDYDTTYRALVTLEAAEYARRKGNNWQMTARLGVIAGFV